MIFNSLSIVVSLAIPILIYSYKYIVDFDNDDIMTPCEGESDNYITSWCNLNLTFTVIGDDEIIVGGYLESIISFEPNDTIYLDVAIYKEVWGEYQLPVAQVKRNDFCKALFNPNEIWYKFVSHLSNEIKCPCDKGTRFPASNWSSKGAILNFPNPNLAGGYRATYIMGVNYNEKKYFCLNIDSHLYKQ